MCEYSSSALGLMPELSYGSHFFQDLVETGIFYAALFAEKEDVGFCPERFLKNENLLTRLLTHGGEHQDTLYVCRTPGVEVYSDIVSQTAVCR